MATQPPYGWRVPLDSDRPGGARQMRELAADIAATLRGGGNVFTDAAARDAAITAPAKGMTCYLSGVDQHQRWNGSMWVPYAGAMPWVTARQPGTGALPAAWSTLPLTEITGFSAGDTFSLAAGKVLLPYPGRWLVLPSIFVSGGPASADRSVTWRSSGGTEGWWNHYLQSNVQSIVALSATVPVVERVASARAPHPGAPQVFCSTAGATGSCFVEMQFLG